VPGTLRNERRLAGIDVGKSGASARVMVGAGEPAPVDVRLELTLRYPATVRGVVDAVRTAVADDLSRVEQFHSSIRLMATWAVVRRLTATSLPEIQWPRLAPARSSAGRPRSRCSRWSAS
jgi:hypothetical protein